MESWLRLGKMCSILSLFFFSSRRRHSRFDCDWSSDVCSSDLPMPGADFQGVESQPEPAVPTPPAATSRDHNPTLRADIGRDQDAGILHERPHRLHQYLRPHSVPAARDPLHESNGDPRARGNHQVRRQQRQERERDRLHKAPRIRSTVRNRTSVVREGANASKVTALARGQRLTAYAPKASISSEGSTGAIHGPPRSRSSATPATWSSTTCSSGNSASQRSGATSW